MSYLRYSVAAWEEKAIAVSGTAGSDAPKPFAGKQRNKQGVLELGVVAWRIRCLLYTSGAPVVISAALTTHCKDFQSV